MVCCHAAESKFRGWNAGSVVGVVVGVGAVPGNINQSPPSPSVAGLCTLGGYSPWANRSCGSFRAAVIFYWCGHLQRHRKRRIGTALCCNESPCFGTPKVGRFRLHTYISDELWQHLRAHHNPIYDAPVGSKYYPIMGGCLVRGN